MKSKVLLIRPPSVTKGMNFIATQFPLNIASIAANLAANDCEVRIWDFDVEPMDEQAFAARLKEFSPLLVGISCYTPTITSGGAIARLVKKHLPGAQTVVGGPHVSALPEATMEEFRDFDIGAVGEGEEVLVELARQARQSGRLDDVPGIWFRKNGAVVTTGPRMPIRDLDKLPFPLRELLNWKLYTGQSHRGFSRSFLKITEIMTARGCPNRCAFCASDVVMGKGVRFRSASYVLKEIDECVSRFGVNHFVISDDTFTLNEDRLYEICEGFSRHKVSWNCNARVWPLSKKILSAMARSGCKGITFGVESGSPRVLKLIKKNVTIEQIRDAFRWSREAGIKLIEADIIVGAHPDETAEDVRMTKKLLAGLAPDIIMASIIVPYPGTEIYRIMSERGLIFQDKQWDSFTLFGKEPAWRTEHYTPKGLVKLQKDIIAGFYFNPLYMIRMLRKMESLGELSYWFQGGLGFLRVLRRKS
ncbi:MAG: radical SAM protein [Candidatus Omnitrophica bacterium]|nr:radical SAM protein [Candidatus Omnitrophota bacterium]